jgi:hypothetical protein
VVAKTVRRTLLHPPGRLTRSARRWCCTCPPAGPGPMTSRWRWPGCAASRTRPDVQPRRAASTCPPGPWERPRSVSATLGCQLLTRP